MRTESWVVMVVVVVVLVAVAVVVVVVVTGVMTYLWSSQAFYQWNHVQRRVFSLQALHLGVQTFTL